MEAVAWARRNAQYTHVWGKRLAWLLSKRERMRKNSPLVHDPGHLGSSPTQPSSIYSDKQSAKNNCIFTITIGFSYC